MIGSFFLEPPGSVALPCSIMFLLKAWGEGTPRGCVALAWGLAYLGSPTALPQLGQRVFVSRRHGVPQRGQGRMALRAMAYCALGKRITGALLPVAVRNSALAAL